MTQKQRSFLIFQREFLNHILIMHPWVQDYEGMEKFKDMDEWFEYTNLPPSIEKNIKEHWKDTIYGNYPYYVQGEDFFSTIPFALFNSLRDPANAEIMDQSGFVNWKEVVCEDIGGYYGLVEPDDDGNLEHDEESARWANEEGDYGLFHDNPEWNMKLDEGNAVCKFVHKFHSYSIDLVNEVVLESGLVIPYSNQLLKSLFYNLHELIHSHINGHLALHSFHGYVNQQKITPPPYLPKVSLSNRTSTDLPFTDEQHGYFSQAIPAGIEPHNNNRRYYLPQDYFDGVGYYTENFDHTLQFKCEYLEYEDVDGLTCPPPYRLTSLVSYYCSETKEIDLNQFRIAALARRFGYEFEDFCQAVLCKNLGFWLTQDLCAYPTQWFLRIDMDFLHFYSNYFAEMLCENENQKNILALLALLGPKEHQSYYRTPIVAITECASKIIDNLPSLRTHWNPHKRREDLEVVGSNEEIHECLKSFIPFDKNKKQRPEQYKLSDVLGQNTL